MKIFIILLSLVSAFGCGDILGFLDTTEKKSTYVSPYEGKSLRQIGDEMGLTSECYKRLDAICRKKKLGDCTPQQKFDLGQSMCNNGTLFQ